MNSYEHTSRDFLPLSVIRSACAGDTDAVEQVLQHYRGYINKLCTGILYDKHGQPHVCMGNFTFEEMNLMCIYNTGSRTGLIEALTEMCGELAPEETELRELTDSALTKLCAMTDEDFAQLELYPDFDQ